MSRKQMSEIRKQIWWTASFLVFHNAGAGGNLVSDFCFLISGMAPPSAHPFCRASVGGRGPPGSSVMIQMILGASSSAG
jgi:hypothetical protein